MELRKTIDLIEVAPHVFLCDRTLQRIWKRHFENEFEVSFELFLHTLRCYAEDEAFSFVSDEVVEGFRSILPVSYAGTIDLIDLVNISDFASLSRIAEMVSPQQHADLLAHLSHQGYLGPAGAP